MDINDHRFPAGESLVPFVRELSDEETFELSGKRSWDND